MQPLFVLTAIPHRLAVTLTLALSIALPACLMAADHEVSTSNASFADLTGIRILHTTYGNFAGAPSLLLSDLQARGATVDVLNHTTNPYPLLDDTVDILFLHALGSVPSDADLAALLSWVRSGGKSILLAGVTYWIRDTANLLSDSLSAGWQCRLDSGSPSTITDFDSHPITYNVTSLENILTGFAACSQINPPAHPLFRRAEGQVVGAYSTPGNSCMVLIGVSILWDNRINLADNRVLANQAIDWLVWKDATVSVEMSTWSTAKSRYRE